MRIWRNTHVVSLIKGDLAMKIVTVVIVENSLNMIYEDNTLLNIHKEQFLIFIIYIKFLIFNILNLYTTEKKTMGIK